VRAVIDTNVLISGLLWHGPPHRLIERVRLGEVTFIGSSVLLTEAEEVQASAGHNAFPA
jgi:predicted nucleic acid-binding protein